MVWFQHEARFISRPEIEAMCERLLVAARERLKVDTYRRELGGKRLLGASHMASAVYGTENNLGNLLTPVRACFNYAEEHFLASRCSTSP